jgi:hypothetical protein
VSTLDGDPCTHWWMIEPATGPQSEGVCKRCGELKLFDNSIATMIEGTFGSKGPGSRKKRPGWESQEFKME